ncbi:hypothetical protein [Trinickia mobilis]|uniref:hypothetical protein n=1 Tax=Trinickia mobilis TaxID=2816356 RepID=UPI001A8FFA20|nr:hypothetical protein [Trinickia mobilis]
MQAVKLLRVLLFAGAALANAAIASDHPITGTGEFVGHGRQCDGRLRVNAKTIEWRTPFASCGKRPYAVIERDLQAAKPSIVFQLKGRACGFGIISLHWDPEYPDYWIAKGYRNLEAYKSNSTDFLGCSLEKQGK